MDDFYQLDLQPSSGARCWSIPETKGGRPAARESHTAVAYAGRGSPKLFIFGGMQGRRLDDLWQLDLGRPLSGYPLMGCLNWGGSQFGERTSTPLFVLPLLLIHPIC